jgi:DNA-binding NtrC family response regulator
MRSKIRLGTNSSDGIPLFMQNKKKESILVVALNGESRDVLTAFLRQHDFNINTSDNLSAVLSQLREGRVAAEIVIIESQGLPSKGIEFIHQLHQIAPDLPALLVTSDKDAQTAIDAFHAGAYDVMVRPFEYARLLESMARAAESLAGTAHRNHPVDDSTDKSSAAPSSEGHDRIIWRSESFRDVLDIARRVANSRANVYIKGESGVGKELIAREVHRLGRRQKFPFVAINCSAIPENLLESELFGHIKGAFTGAVETRLGLFEAAQNGTLFLDEIGDLNPVLQSKLLRVLQEHKIKRIGENQTRDVNARIICATHKNLKKEVMEGRFREDLFFRLNVIPIEIPPLRERPEDIMPLAEFFLQKYTRINSVPTKHYARCAVDKLMTSSWRGNVRELENAIERAVVLSETNIIYARDLRNDDEQWHPQEILNGQEVLTINELVNKYVKHVLDKNGWAKEKSSRDLGIDRKTLYRRIKEIEMNHH